MEKYVNDFWSILKTPKKFFKSVKKEKGLFKPFIYFVISTLIIYILTLIQVVVDSIYNPELEGMLIISLLLILLIIGLYMVVSIVLSPFISTCITYLGLLIVGVRNISFENVFKVISYSNLVALAYSVPLMLVLILSSPLTYKESYSTFDTFISIIFFIALVVISVLQIFHFIKTIGIGLSFMNNIGFWRGVFGYLVIQIIFGVLILGLLIIFGAFFFFIEHEGLNAITGAIVGLSN